MANINSISGSTTTTSSVSNPNAITGLATGMDTEAMIEKSVSGIKSKISSLQQSQTKVEWRQEAMRSILDKMSDLSSKYTSYTSPTNLMSNQFFTGNVTVTPTGAYADRVSATGKSNTDIQIKSVDQLATSSRYSVNASALNMASGLNAEGTAIDWEGTFTQPAFSGTLTLSYGNRTVDLKLDPDDLNIGGSDYQRANTTYSKSAAARTLADAITKKLAETDVRNKDGELVKGSELFQGLTVTKDGDIRFNGTTDGQLVTITSASGDLKSNLGVGSSSIRIWTNTDQGTFQFYKKQNAAEYLSGKTIDVTLDGVTKSVSLGNLTNLTVSTGGTSSPGGANETDILSDDDTSSTATEDNALMQQLVKNLQTSLDKSFGKNRVHVTEKDGALAFEATGGSTLKVAAEDALSNSLGMGETGLTNYFDTSKNLGTLLKDETAGNTWFNQHTTIEVDESQIDTSRNAFDKSKGILYDTDGNLVRKIGMAYYRVDEDGNQVYEQNGMKVDPTEIDTTRDPYNPQISILYDKSGNLVKKFGDDYYRVDSDGDMLYELKINGASVGAFNGKNSLESVLNTINGSDAGVTATYSRMTNQFTFTSKETGELGEINFDSPLAARLFQANGNTTTMKTLKDALSGWKWDSDGSTTLSLDGKELGSFKRTDTVQDVIDAINAGGDYTVAFSDNTGAFRLLDKDGNALSDSLSLTSNTGSSIAADSTVPPSIGRPGGFFYGLDDSAQYTRGQDAQLTAIVNGKEMAMKRGSNVVNMDGMNVTLKGTFQTAEGEEAVGFQTSADTTEITDAIRSFVDEFNALAKEIHDAYSTQPAEKNSSTHARYEPLTEEDKADMSDIAIERYEEKAKQGILFGDNDLSNLYSRLISAISPGGADRKAMEAIGLTTQYSNGLTTLTLDEGRLKSALEANAENVKNVFSSATVSSNGLMSKMKQTLDTYGSTAYGNLGVLVRKAGSTRNSSSLLNNTMQSQINNYQTQIEKWQDKMSNSIDRYTKLFTQLEQLTAKMNSQSSALSGLMGGY